jgi:hypothetical protein
VIGYELTVDGLEEQITKLMAYDEISHRHLRAAMQKSLITIGSEVVPLIPVGVSGRLKNSMGSEIQELGPSNLVGRFGSSLKDEVYPQVMEFGRKPGKMPPVESLLRWVHLKINPGVDEEYSVAFLIARKIGKAGIKGKKFMKKGYAKAKERVVGYFNQALENIAEDLANGN